MLSNVLNLIMLNFNKESQLYDINGSKCNFYNIINFLYNED